MATPDQFKQLQDIMAKKDFIPEEKVKSVISLYDQLKIKSITEKLANEYIITAFKMLEMTRVVKERKNFLECVTHSLIGRDK